MTIAVPPKSTEQTEHADDLLPLNLSTNVLADDCSGASEWQLLLDHASLNPGKFVLSAGGYRMADPAKLLVSLATRCALVSAFSVVAVKQLGNSALLESKGLWPKWERLSDRASRPITDAVLRILHVLKCFSVEDEESLAVLLRACSREIESIDAHGKAGQAARTALQQFLGHAEWEARQALESVLRKGGSM